MSHLLIELYNPKSSWQMLSQEDQQSFFVKIGSGMNDLLALGITPLAFGEIEQDVPHSSAQRFYAVWSAPNRSALDTLVNSIAESGWHHYFETSNTVGQSVDLSAHLGQLLKV